MNSTPIRRFDFKVALVALACIGGCGFGGYLLYHDYYQVGGAGAGKPLARVERREASVRRKPARSFAWTHVQPQEQLYRRDSVQTSTGSAASIRFNDGTSVELGENSLVVIDDLTHLSLDFLKGSVVLHTSEGDKRVTTGKDGHAKFELLPIHLIKPEPLVRFFTREREAKPVHFAWKVRGGSGASLPPQYFLQISQNRSFQGAAIQSIVVKNQGVFEADASLATGSWYWRLATAEKALTEISRFSVLSALPLRPMGPGHREKLLHYGESPVQFRWEHPGESQQSEQIGHEIQVALDGEFRSVIASQRVEGTSGHATLKGLPDGELHWRIVSTYADLSVTSASEHFTISQAQRPELALVLPRENQSFERLPQMRFNWNSSANELAYQWELQGTQGKEVLSYQGTSNSFLWKKPEAGAYRWRVSALHKGQVVAETDWRTFSIFEGARIYLVAPAKSEEIHYWDKPTGFSFQWRPDELLEKHGGYAYQVELAGDAEFKASTLGPQSRTPALPSEKLQLPPGEYFWRVHIVDAAGQTLKSSEISKFTYGIHPPLNAPVALGPAPATVFNLMEQQKNPVVSWQENKDAEGYEVTVYAAEPGRVVASVGGAAPGKVVLQTTTKSPSMELKGLKPADYLWTVRANDRIQRKGQPMVPRSFEVTFGALLGSPEIVSPEVQ